MVAATLAALALAACTGTIVNEDVVTQPTLRQPALEGDLVDVTVEADALTLRYAGDAPSFAAGETVWGTEGPGYLRKVVAVDDRGDTVRLSTVQGALSDGFERVKVELDAVPITTPVTPVVDARDERITIPGLDGRPLDVTVTFAAPTTSALTTTSATTMVWEFPELAISVSDPQGLGTLTLAARKVRVEKDITLDFAIDWRWLQLDTLRFIVDDHTRYTIEELAVSVDGSVPLLAQDIPLFVNPALVTLPAGPFVFTVGVSVSLGLDAVLAAAGELHTTSEVSLASHLRHGVVWSDGAFETIDEGDVVVDADVGEIVVDGRAALSADVTVKGSLRFALWGVIGPELWGEVAPVEADLGVDLEGWELALAARATGGLRFVMPGVDLSPLDVDFGTWQETYYQTSGTW